MSDLFKIDPFLTTVMVIWSTYLVMEGLVRITKALRGADK